MRFEIEFRNSRWLVNGKRLEDMNEDERMELDNFFREYKASLEIYKNATC